MIELPTATYHAIARPAGLTSTDSIPRCIIFDQAEV
jgi:hypothetical protein